MLQNAAAINATLAPICVVDYQLIALTKPYGCWF